MNLVFTETDKLRLGRSNSAPQDLSCSKLCRGMPKASMLGGCDGAPPERPVAPFPAGLLSSDHPPQDHLYRPACCSSLDVNVGTLQHAAGMHFETMSL